MTWRAVIFQVLAATALWGLGMTLVFDWPRETILLPMAMFGMLMFAVLGTLKMIRDRGRTK